MSITEILVKLGPILANEFIELGRLIAGSGSPGEAIAKAKRNLELDAMDAAADLAVDEALKKLHGK